MAWSAEIAEVEIEFQRGGGWTMDKTHENSGDFVSWVWLKICDSNLGTPKWCHVSQDSNHLESAFKATKTVMDVTWLHECSSNGELG